MNLPASAFNLSALLDHLEDLSPEEAFRIVKPLLDPNSNPHATQLSMAIMSASERRPNPKMLSEKLADLRQAISYKLATQT